LLRGTEAYAQFDDGRLKVVVHLEGPGIDSIDIDTEWLLTRGGVQLTVVDKRSISLLGRDAYLEHFQWQHGAVHAVMDRVTSQLTDALYLTLDCSVRDSVPAVDECRRVRESLEEGGRQVAPVAGHRVWPIDRYAIQLPAALPVTEFNTYGPHGFAELRIGSAPPERDASRAVSDMQRPPGAPDPIAQTRSIGSFEYWYVEVGETSPRYSAGNLIANHGNPDAVLNVKMMGADRLSEAELDSFLSAVAERSSLQRSPSGSPGPDP
jgi:hypothetical protein